jgi:hypothetical protein
MRRYELLVLSIVSWIMIQGSVKSTVDIYYIYNGGTDHSNPANYTTTTEIQVPVFGNVHLRWIMIRDDDGTVTPQEFCDMYDAVDRSIPQNTNLDDDVEGFVFASPPYVYRLEKGK